jgi:hypothetical protein
MLCELGPRAKSILKNGLRDLQSKPADSARASAATQASVLLRDFALTRENRIEPLNIKGFLNRPMG